MSNDFGLRRTRVKICCIANSQEAELAIRYGADALGLVGEMPSGPGIISDDVATEISSRTPPPVSTFLLTSETRADRIADHVLKVGASTVQIVTHIDTDESKRLADLIPHIRRVQVIHVEDDTCLSLIRIYEENCHAFLLDSGKPSAAVPELGGTGRTHNWEISRQFIMQSKLPVFLAGGLTPENVGNAIDKLQPFGVDLCSGVRSYDKLDEEKLSAFMKAVRTARS